VSTPEIVAMAAGVGLGVLASLVGFKLRGKAPPDGRGFK